MNIWRRILCFGAHRDVRQTPLLDEEHIWTPPLKDVPARDTGEARYTLLECRACGAKALRDVWDRRDSWRLAKGVPDEWALGIRWGKERDQERAQRAILERHRG